MTAPSLVSHFGLPILIRFCPKAFNCRNLQQVRMLLDCCSPSLALLCLIGCKREAVSRYGMNFKRKRGGDGDVEGSSRVLFIYVCVLRGAPERKNC